MTTNAISSFYNEANTNRRGRSKDLTPRSLQLFNQTLASAQRHRAWRRMTGKREDLLDLNTEVAPANGHYAGVQPVPIERIKGSLGRAGDFDAEFRPLQERIRSRWISVANAQQSGIPLPAVDLIRVGEDYFVRDGHHRISVARALGQTIVDAEVTVW